MGEEEIYDIPDFNLVASFRRHDRPAAGVAIYKWLSDTTAIFCANHMNLHTRYTSMSSTILISAIYLFVVATVKMNSKL